MQTKPRSLIGAAMRGFVDFLNEGVRTVLRVLFNVTTLCRLPRVLAQGPDQVLHRVHLKSIEMRNMREIKRLLADNAPLTFVTSYPRSGNTWIRYLLSDVFLQNLGVETTTELVVHPDNIIPDFYRSLVAARNPRVRTPGVCIKIHDSFGQLRDRFWGQDYLSKTSFQICRHLYLFRSPGDALVSFYHFHLQKKFLLEKSVENAGPRAVDEFCRQALPEWITHVSSYLQAAENGIPIYFASYEQLLSSPQRVLGDVLRWLDVPHSAVMLDRAAANMDFHKLKATKARDIGTRGRDGGGSTELQRETIVLINAQTAETTAKLYKRAGQIPAAFARPESV